MFKIGILGYTKPTTMTSQIQTWIAFFPCLYLRSHWFGIVLNISFEQRFLHILYPFLFFVLWLCYSYHILNILMYLMDEKTTVKRDQFFIGNQYFSPTNNFTRLKLTPTKNFYVLQSNLFERFSTFFTISLAFSIASVIPAFLKPFIAISLSTLRVLYRSTIHFALRIHFSRRLISQNWSVTLAVVVKKKMTSTLTLILMNQLNWTLNNFLRLKYNFIGIIKAFWLTWHV